MAGQQCPDCGALFRPGAFVCPECGIELFDADPEADVVEPADEDRASHEDGRSIAPSDQEVERGVESLSAGWQSESSIAPAAAPGRSTTARNATAARSGGGGPQRVEEAGQRRLARERAGKRW
jgi:predicted  nucleic acid-binding Zn-ribbon protein